MKDKTDQTTAIEEFKIIGYYICEVVDMPEYLKELGKRILSVDDGLGEIHPKLNCYFLNGWRKGEREAYQKRLKLSDEQYTEYAEIVRKLFESKKMAFDCRFLHLSDAQYFHKKFCTEISCRIVSISTIPAYFDILSEEMKHGHDGGVINGEPDHNITIGSGIIGWDIDAFYSFLINSLHKELPEARFNEIGLLQNDFREVIEFARRIKGKGEPVEWIPCRLGDCALN